MFLSGIPRIPRSVVLCIDNSEEVLECETSFLETFGYTVLAAASAGRGLELASTHAVDVVIIDYLMPVMNGQEVAVEMRRLKPQTPIIMLSASVDVPHQVMKLVDAYVNKQDMASQLLPTIALLRGCEPISPFAHEA
jgi:two-component system alkaline phosphatase synthesis response regulator PhoP